jgi:predicted GNAT family N-acyltransferase
MMHELKVRLVISKQELLDCLNIRKRVFIDEQKVPVELEVDEFDDLTHAKHIIAFWKCHPVGTARIRFMKNKAKFERLAVLKKYRSKGIGKEIVRHYIRYAKRKKAKELILHGQYYARSFYAKFGFKARGKKFMDAGIEHIEMFMKQ